MIQIRAAVMVFEAFLAIGDVRAFVRALASAGVFCSLLLFSHPGIADPVGIVIGIRAAVGILEAVLVLGLILAFVVLVGDAVLIGTGMYGIGGEEGREH